MKIILTFPHYIRVFMGCILLLFSASVTALSCPGSKDFVSVNGSLYGWSWKLRPGLVDFNSPNWTFYSPSGDNFLASYPLTTGLYFIEPTSNGEITAQLYCKYELTDVEIISFFSKPKLLNKDEMNRIRNAWKPSKYAYHKCHSSDCNNDLSETSGYECSSTAGTADKCSVEFQPSY